MALMPVNDPELLQQLGSPTGNLSPVSDPELLKQLNGEGTTEDPGLLKSAAAGLMSGVPLAESAVAGVKSLVNDTPYAKEHDALEALKDASWDAHPIAYGAGKTAGMVGTGLVAPEGIPGAIGIGAASGLDQATKLADVPGDVLKGGAVGGVLGTIGEKVISPLLTKSLPNLGKSAVGALGPGKEAVESYLENPEAINNAAGPVAQSEVLQNVANQIRGKVSQASQRALSKLSPDSYTTMEEISPLFDGIKQNMATDGVMAGPTQQAASDALDAFHQSLTSIASKYEGKIPETVLGKLIRDIDDNTNWADQSATTTNNALKELRHSLDTALKASNPDYAEAMKPVSEAANLLSNIRKNFNLKYEPNEGLAATDTTNTKLANVLNETKSHAQDVLNQAGEKSGVDFLGNARDYATKQSFENPKAGLLATGAGHGLGYLVGRMSGIPGAGLAGSILGGIAGHNVDGGAVAKSILDMYIKGSQNMADSGVTAALQKFGPVLANAAKAGGNELASTHFVLATSNPEYQTLVQHTQDNQ